MPDVYGREARGPFPTEKFIAGDPVGIAWAAYLYASTVNEAAERDHARAVEHFTPGQAAAWLPVVLVTRQALKQAMIALAPLVPQA